MTKLSHMAFIELGTIRSTLLNVQNILDNKLIELNNANNEIKILNEKNLLLTNKINELQGTDLRSAEDFDQRSKSPPVDSENDEIKKLNEIISLLVFENNSLYAKSEIIKNVAVCIRNEAECFNQEIKNTYY